MHAMTLSLVGLAILALRLVEICLATPQNRTVDDEGSDPFLSFSAVYNPPSAWTQGVNCTSCKFHASSTLVYNSRYHETLPYNGSSNQPILTIQFIGTAIYIYGVLNPANGTNYFDLGITLDGQKMPEFSVPQLSPTSYQYNVLMFSNTTLANGTHSLALSPLQNSTFLYDYATYTIDPDPPTSKSTYSTRVIAGAIAGGIVAFTFLVVAVVFYVRHRMQVERSADGSVKQKAKINNKIEPFPMSPLEPGYPPAASEVQASKPLA